MATQTARTHDGQVVILEANGTWRYANTPATETRESSDPGFRDVRWGAGIEQTKLIQRDQPLLQKDNVLGYSGNVGGLSCLIFFDFINNQLVKGRYVFNEEHSNDNDHVDDYFSLKDALTQKYGKPKDDQLWWKSDLWKNDPDHWGLAVSSGDLVLFAQWETPITEINLELSGDNYEMRFLAIYESIALKHLTEASSNARKLTGL